MYPQGLSLPVLEGRVVAAADNDIAGGFVVTPDQIYYLRREAQGFATLRSLTLATGKDAQITTLTKTLHLASVYRRP